MSSLRPLRTLRPHLPLRPPPTLHMRTLTTTPIPNTQSPPSNLPDTSKNSSASPNAQVRSTTQYTDKQSSASEDEHKTGDDHPAKQPDYQAEPTRSTGIGGQEEVKGGKGGLGDRGKQ
ncbi:hypothetical protein T440DRAFT_551125 [Plenodomus tracheiphilus IPT5]|uniref:Uncharacterized protein n=1 Tax=Plenodomus tracheiphilus IPT5 TaxID=1408161 RepID=A0A6A7BK78_9PLEO|nr:hypothetical protein T440DRAFT_551125 [Plenodomus tracheiphilus IPT5]